MTQAEALVREFCDAWSKLDPELLAEYFAEDGVYQNMPLPPLHGRAAIKEFLVGFLANTTAAEFRMVNVVSSDDVVFTERIDAFTLDGREGAFPVCGVFEVRNGKIQAWRDYFDMAQVTAFLTGQ